MSGFVSQSIRVFLFFKTHKGAFKYYVILLGGGGESLKRSQKITGGGRGGSPKDHRGSRSQEGGGALKRLVKLEVPIKIIITLRIRYQWVIQEVISS